MNFPQPTFIGDPHEVAPADRRTSGRRSQNDGHWKLQVHFPFAVNGDLYKSAAFDVCRSRVTDTSFSDWNAIRHNVLAQWIDLVDPSANRGLAVMCDGTTAYNYGPSQPLGLVLAWAWDGGFWWGKHPIEGSHTIRFALLPHRGTWAEAALWHEYSRFSEPVLTTLATGPILASINGVSLVDTGSPTLQLSAMQRDESALLLRFFHAAATSATHRVQLGIRVRQLHLVDLRGKPIRTLAKHPFGSAAAAFTLELPPFGLATVRCDLA